MSVATLPPSTPKPSGPELLEVDGGDIGGAWSIHMPNGMVAELEDIGEGWSGDYDPEDPEDEPLYRMDVFFEDPTDDQDDDHLSYCTSIPSNSKLYDYRAILQAYALRFGSTPPEDLSRHKFEEWVTMGWRKDWHAVRLGIHPDNRAAIEQLGGLMEDMSVTADDEQVLLALTMHENP